MVLTAGTYRANLLWENNALRIRDIHLFDENLESHICSKKLLQNLVLTIPFLLLMVFDGVPQIIPPD